MPIILLLIVGVLCLMLSGAWIGSIYDDKVNDQSSDFIQYYWSIGGFLIGLYAIIACIGHVAGVK